MNSVYQYGDITLMIISMIPGTNILETFYIDISIIKKTCRISVMELTNYDV